MTNVNEQETLHNRDTHRDFLTRHAKTKQTRNVLQKGGHYSVLFKILLH